MAKIHEHLLMQDIRAGNFPPCLNPRGEAGRSEVAVVCNSIPKAGTYLLIELIKTLGPWRESRLHLNGEHVDHYTEAGVIDCHQPLPALVSLSQAPRGFAQPRIFLILFAGKCFYRRRRPRPKCCSSAGATLFLNLRVMPA